MGGDFNLVADRWLDRLPPRGQCHNYEGILVEFTSRGSLVDCWRMRNTFIKQFTSHWSVSGQWWSLSIRGEGFKPIPIVLWNFNSRLLEHKEFCNEVKNLVKEIVDLELSPLMKWEWFKCQIMEIAICASKSISRQKKTKTTKPYSWNP